MKKSKTAITSSHNILNNFLSENTKYQINDRKQTIGNLDEISDKNDEIWIVQCPKSINANQLDEHKIKLPGKSNCDLIETFAEEFSTPKEICLGFKNNAAQFQIKQFPLKGCLLIREKLKIIKDENDNVDDGNNLSSMRPPFPSNLKTRHPLHGHQYEEKINLDENIRYRLQKSDEIVKRKKLNKMINKGNANSDNTIAAGRNHKHNTEETTSKQKSFKKIKIENDEDISMDLAWIKNL